jgi:hypothetical protein
MSILKNEVLRVSNELIGIINTNFDLMNHDQELVQQRVSDLEKFKDGMPDKLDDIRLTMHTTIMATPEYQKMVQLVSLVDVLCNDIVSVQQRQHELEITHAVQGVTLAEFRELQMTVHQQQKELDKYNRQVR